MSGEYRELDAEEVATYLGELLDRLNRRGVQADVYLIGGAAMALHLGRDSLTPDIDGLFHPRAEVMDEARGMASEYGLDPGWINDRAFSFMSFDPADDEEAVSIELRGFPVLLASKRVLLALKIAASRTKDFEDTNRLILDLGISEAEDIVALTRAVLGANGVTLPDNQYELHLIVEEALRRAERYARESQQPHAASRLNARRVLVAPYRRADGLFVESHWRSAPRRSGSSL